MPETYRYLQLRLQIKQQRFLNFGMEAGVLFADGVICETLQINRSLLLAVLAEIKMLLETYATTNGKYERYTPHIDDDRENFEEPDTALMELLCPPLMDGKLGVPERTISESSKYRQAFSHLSKSIIQKGRNLRTIIREPKRLTWVAVDKESFESLVSKIEHLNSVLISLLDSSQIRRLQDTVSTAYLEVVQLRSDVESLTCLIKALSAKRTDDIGLGIVQSQNSPLYLAVKQETEVQERRREYLKQLVQIKIQLTKMDHLNDESLNFSERSVFASTCLEPADFEFVGDHHDLGNVQQRSSSTYQGSSVWIEWKEIAASGYSHGHSAQIEYRIGLLTNLLCHEKPVGFRAPPCLGYVKLEEDEAAARFGIVFQKPLDTDADAELQTLAQLLDKRYKPPLSTRMSLCAALARCIYSFHAVNWLHKGLRGDNILFFSISPDRVRFSAPYVSGFELSRPSIIENWTEKPSFDPEADIYRHPSAQSFQADRNYRKAYDMYSLGVIFVEIALWRRINDIMGLEDMTKIKPSTLQGLQSRLLERLSGEDRVLLSGQGNPRSCLHQVASECSDAFRDVVECCLTADSVERPQYLGEPESSIALRLQMLTEEDIVKKLEHISGVLQARS